MPVAVIRTVSVKRLPSKNEHWKKWRTYVAYDKDGPDSKGMLNVIKILYETEAFLITDTKVMNAHRDAALAVADAWSKNPYYTELERVLINTWTLTGDPKKAKRARDVYARGMSNAAGKGS